MYHKIIMPNSSKRSVWINIIHSLHKNTWCKIRKTQLINWQLVDSLESFWSLCFPHNLFLFSSLSQGSYSFLLFSSLLLILPAEAVSHPHFSVLCLFGGGLQTFPVKRHTFRLVRKRGSWEEREEEQQKPPFNTHPTWQSAWSHIYRPPSIWYLFPC